jgi:hypothetical protein
MQSSGVIKQEPIHFNHNAGAIQNRNLFAVEINASNGLTLNNYEHKGCNHQG